MTWPSALVQWQYNLCQPALRTSGEIKINVPAVLFKIKTCRRNLSSFHIDLIGSMATECPPVVTSWSFCPSGPCCQVLLSSHSGIWGSDLPSRVQIAASCILALTLSSYIRTLVSGAPSSNLEPVFQSGQGFRPWQQLLLSDEDNTWLTNSCHLPGVWPAALLGISRLCKASCRHWGVIPFIHFSAFEEEDILWSSGGVNL